MKAHLIMNITGLLKKYELQNCWAALPPFCKSTQILVMSIMLYVTWHDQLNSTHIKGIIRGISTYKFNISQGGF